MRRLLVLLPLILVAPSAAAGQAAGGSSHEARSVPLFTSRDAIVGAAALAGTILLVQVDRDIVEFLQDSSLQENSTISYIARRISPFNEVKALYGSAGVYLLARVAGQERWADVGLHALEAQVIAKLVMELGGGASGRSRPRTSPDTNAFDFEWLRGFREEGYGAFPSKHMMGVSALAASLSSEVAHHWPGASRWVTPAAYTVAGLVGVGRMYTNNHWASDVLAAGVIGIFIGNKTVRFNHAHPNSWVDKIMLGSAPTRAGEPRLVIAVPVAW
jgi:hypothetical protein